jgi:hypothetical protein
LCFSFLVLGVESRAFLMVSTCYTADLHPHSNVSDLFEEMT